jgi:hypothetical protein
VAASCGEHWIIANAVFRGGVTFDSFSAFNSIIDL